MKKSQILPTLLALTFSLVACKEIEVVKTKKGTTSSSAAPMVDYGIALYTAQEELLGTSKLFSIDTKGVINKIQSEEGQDLENLYINTVIPVKSGLIFSVYNGNLNQSENYFTNGKTAQKLSYTGQFSSSKGESIDYSRSAKTRFSFFCSQGTAMAWDDNLKTITAISQTSGSCQVAYSQNKLVVVNSDYQMFFMGPSTISTKITKFSFNEDSIGEPEVMSDSSSLINYVDSLDVVDNKVIMIRTIGADYSNVVRSIVSINLDNNSSENLLSVSGNDSYIYKLTNKKLDNGKLFFVEQRYFQGDSYDVLYEDTQNVYYSSTGYQNRKLISYSSQEGLSVLIDKTYQSENLGYEFIVGEDTAFVIKDQYYPSQEGDSYRTYNLYNLNDLENPILASYYDSRVPSQQVFHFLDLKTGLIIVSKDMVQPDQPTQKEITAYVLPSATRELGVDKRIVLGNFNYVNFINFYGQVLYNYSSYISETDSYEMKAGFVSVLKDSAQMIEQLNPMFLNNN